MTRGRLVRTIVLLSATLGVLRAGIEPAHGQESFARAWKDKVTIPTYPLGQPDKIPLFAERRAYQGAEAPIYPYAMLDALIDKRVDKTYDVVYLENRYVRISVLPEIGGRVFSAYDKTNGYDYLYRQHVIKPALIGMVGAWISGGIEWNIPHHHRASTFMPVDYSFAQEPDGSAVVRVGELELRDRMRWVVELRLRPDSSCIEQTVRLINRTAATHSFLFFANIAVSANDDYQVLFPPDVCWVTHHGKREFSKWPIADHVFNGIDFRNGVDVSWWTNHPSPISMFVWGSHMDFVGGYDHGRKAGMVHVADHHISAGKKFFTWGAGEEGRMWDRVLTETDGPYIELMAGSYSDNQPDYSWIHPYQTKVAETFWYPISQIGGVKNATRQAAVNLETTSTNAARIGVAVSSPQTDARALLSGKAGIIQEVKFNADPGHPFVTECRLPADAGKLSVRVTSADGEELVAYTTVDRVAGESPEPIHPPAAPDEIDSVEALYQAAVRLEQLHSAALDPEDYYREVLRRDPAHAAANTALGVRAWRRCEFAEAEKFLEKALQRIPGPYLAPEDGRTHYYRGLTERALGKAQEACDSFGRAAWVAGWESPANFQLAELSCLRGDFDHALVYLDRALVGNTQHVKALTLKAAILRRLDRESDAQGFLARAVTIDPLDPWPVWESFLLHGGSAPAGTDWQSVLEPATDYANAGLWPEATSVLETISDGPTANAMVDYFLAYCLEKMGKSKEADARYAAAAAAATDYVFPFRREAFDVLQRARERAPNDDRAAYYLGNLFMLHRQHDKAIAQWEDARRLNPDFALVHRNLAQVYAKQEDGLDRAVASMEKAVELADQEPRFYLELDQLYEAANVPVAKRLAVLEKNHAVVAKRDDSLSREIALLVETRRVERALSLLEGRQFHVWEGAGRTAVHNSFSKAHLVLGRRQFAAGRYRKALEEFEASLEYPVNLGTGRPLRGDHQPESHFEIGETHAAMGDREAARRSYEKAVECAPVNYTMDGGPSARDPEPYYYAAKALGRLGRDKEATDVYKRLIEAGEAHLTDHIPMFFFASFGHPEPKDIRYAQAHYTIGLGLLGLGQEAEAKREFEQAVQLNPNHSAARESISGRDGDD